MTLSSVITPGPGGTTMLGERSGLEACARRHIERQKRERHEAEEAAVQKSKVIDDGAISEATLATDSTNTGESTQHRELVINGEQRPRMPATMGKRRAKANGKDLRSTFDDSSPSQPRGRSFILVASILQGVLFAVPHKATRL